ncbi:hypothetical protein [Vulcanimicrobium alpinum]|uniref:anti-sigma factor family protein n=1 Tax=Vulcanimicrobium alpinum TaxID=3016050 RepID=UPI00295F0230|nr:hypothetical protein [Vulcanimicrobium alpinum]
MKRFEHHPNIIEIGTTAFENRVATQLHLAKCSSCRTRLAELEQVRQALASTASIDLTPSRVLTDSALRQLRRQKTNVARVNRLLSVVSAIFAAFAVLLPRHKAAAAAPIVSKEAAEHD